MPSLNPFAALTREIAQKVLADHQLKRQAERRLKNLLAGYREMIDDPRYKAVRKELLLSFGEQLQRLVERAQTCHHCAPQANRIVMLKEFIAAPLETVLFEEAMEETAVDEAEEIAEDA